MLMENTLKVDNKDCLEYVFDLKGSSVDRLAKKGTGTLKDINFKQKCSDPNFLDLPKSECMIRY